MGGVADKRRGLGQAEVLALISSAGLSLTSSAPANPAAAAAVGVGTKAARDDHVHQWPPKSTYATGGDQALAPADIGAEATANKAVANGYASLDASSRVVQAAQLLATVAPGTGLGKVGINGGDLLFGDGATQQVVERTTRKNAADGYPGLTVNKALMLDKANTGGIQVDLAAPVYPWRDMKGRLIGRTTGPNAPNFNVYQGPIRQWEYTSGALREQWIEFHLDHDYVIGTDVHLHFHWSQAVVDTGAGGSPGDVRWFYDLLYAKGHDQDTFTHAAAGVAQQTASAVQWRHMIAEVQVSDSPATPSRIDRTLLEPDGVLLVRVYRDSADPGDTLDQQPFLHFVDVHYQSTNIGTKNRTPGFYT